MASVVVILYVCAFWFQWARFFWQLAGKFRGPCA